MDGENIKAGDLMVVCRFFFKEVGSQRRDLTVAGIQRGRSAVEPTVIDESALVDLSVKNPEASAFMEE